MFLLLFRVVRGEVGPDRRGFQLEQRRTVAQAAGAGQGFRTCPVRSGDLPTTSKAPCSVNWKRRKWKSSFFSLKSNRG